MTAPAGVLRANLRLRACATLHCEAPNEHAQEIIPCSLSCRSLSSANQLLDKLL
jgi:hypothetical protein